MEISRTGSLQTAVNNKVNSFYLISWKMFTSVLIWTLVMLKIVHGAGFQTRQSLRELCAASVNISLT